MMRLQQFTNYLLQHRFKALLFTFAITFVPVVGIVGILIAALITLISGIAEGALFTATATLPFIISFYFSGTGNAVMPIAVWAAVGVAVLSNILTWVFAVMLRKQSGWSQILQIAALFGVLVVSVVHLAYPGVVDWWGTQLQSYYSQAQAAASAVLQTSDQVAQGVAATATTPNEAQMESINVTKQYATGLMVAAVLFNAVLQLIVARWWQVLVYSPGVLRRELHNIRLSQLAGVLFVASLVFAYMGNSVVLDIMPILYLLFGVAGLSLIHYAFSLFTASSKWFWLSLLYMTLIFALPVSALLVAFIALLDVWLDIRKRIQKV